jgi:ABC-type lipoprotein export system ATPase subunit
MLKTLKLENISHKYENNWVLNDISYEFQNKKYVLMGPSGIGKSTLLNIANKIIKPLKGNVICNHNIGCIFQNINLLNDFTLKENIELALKIKNIKGEYAELARLCQIDKILNKYPNQVSGGQKQHTAIVRALAMKATFLIADEPTGNLDPNSAQVIRNLFNLMHQQFGIGWIVSSHDSQWLSIADETLTITEGKLTKLNEPTA